MTDHDDLTDDDRTMLRMRVDTERTRQTRAFRWGEQGLVSEALRAELRNRAWTHSILAEIIGSSVGEISRIVNGRRGISYDLSHRLGAAFGHDHSHWRRLWDADRIRESGNDETRRPQRRRPRAAGGGRTAH